MRLHALVAALSLVACIPDAPPPGVEPPPNKQASGAQQAPPRIDANLAQDPKALLGAVEQMRDKLKDRPRDFNVNVALANLFYDNGKYIDAIEYYTDAIAVTEPVRQRLLADEDAKPAAQAPEACRLVSRAMEPAEGAAPAPNTFEAVSAEIDALSKTDRAAAAACLAGLRPVVANAHARRGNAWYLVGNPEKAKEDHGLALELEKDHPEALFFMGALTLELARGDEEEIERGSAYWKRLLEVAPDHNRAEIVRTTLPRVKEMFGKKPDPMPGHPPVGGSAPMAGHPPIRSGSTAAGPAPLPPGMAEAMSQVERTPELEASLDKQLEEGEAFLAEGKWEQARQKFMAVMPLRPTARLALGLGIALRELGKPTAERVLQQSAVMPGADVPRSRFELARLYEKTNPAEAKRIYRELGSDPKVGAQARERLAALK